jgi:hypothetical protein
MLTRHRSMKLVFGEMKAEFLKRADGDVLFRSRDGRRVIEAVREAAATGERVTIPVEVVATVPKKYGDEPVARFAMTLSVKMKGAPAVRAEEVEPRSGTALH